MELGPKQKIWVEALKSGTYKQGCYKLWDESNNSFCCLGVANDCLGLGESKYNAFLSHQYEELGLLSPAGAFKDGFVFETKFKDLCGQLSTMNDYGVSHKEIAEFIEQNPEIVFSRSV